MQIKKYKVDGWNNFCRVFELPIRYPGGFCFGGGIETIFTMVDWFNPVSGLEQPAVSKEVWKEKVGQIKIREVTAQFISEKLFPFLTKKLYTRKGRKYLIVCDFGLALIFDYK